MLAKQNSAQSPHTPLVDNMNSLRKDDILALLGNDWVEVADGLDCLVVHCRAENILSVLSTMRDASACRFLQLIDICSVDFPGRLPRFDVVYHLLSVQKNQRIRIKLQVAENQEIPSCLGLFPAAGWWEREVWDMMGIPFSGHPDLRRILTDYGFEGHPLRKDFPLTGFNEVRYDETRKAVVYEPVNLQQNFRQFDFESPWVGPQRSANSHGVELHKLAKAIEKSAEHAHDKAHKDSQ